MAEFKFKVNNEFVTFTKWEDIPDSFEFDHVILFAPYITERPHTQEEHDDMGIWPELLRSLMLREGLKTNNGNNIT